MKLAAELREQVRRRALGLCEYCRLPDLNQMTPHQVDHIIGRQHRGTDELDNLCWCCVRCNLKKGPNVASVDAASDDIVPLFHPRRQVWAEHFVVTRDMVEGKTPSGRATAQLLDMNNPVRVRLRSLLRSR